MSYFDRRKNVENVSLAAARSKDAQEQIANLEIILARAARQQSANLSWDDLKIRTSFQVARPKLKIPLTLPEKPSPDSPKYRADLSAFDHYVNPWKQDKILKAQKLFELDLANWTKAADSINTANYAILENNSAAQEKWETERTRFEEVKSTTNARIERHRAGFAARDPEAIAAYFECALASTAPLDFFKTISNVKYIAETKVLALDYALPSPDEIPNVKEVKYNKTKNLFIEIVLSEVARKRLYDSVLYQLTLSAIHHLYRFDGQYLIDAVVFNGWVDSIDRATGHHVLACILSVQAGRNEFLAINLEHVDPKACFKNLKGIGSSSLHGLSPIAPIFNVNSEDKRFVSSYQVVDNVSGGTNLAAMDWEDFENLIRELFEKEFSQNGGVVKITRASRDGGVDAVAFDPDPIRGGKIVIQAKRYTNPVGVSAVRDLYGTVLNEGATKGILVTTADYGPDSYEFAKGKPLTLLSGSNLLSLLQKHGHHATIDLKAAKIFLAAEKEKGG